MNGRELVAHPQLHGAQDAVTREVARYNVAVSSALLTRVQIYSKGDS